MASNHLLYSWPTVFTCLLYGTLASSTICNSAVYGSPNYDDCKRAISKIPFAQAPPPNIRGQLLRNFVEPQLLQPPFRGVSNAYRRDAIVQIPRIWKYNSCRIALMSEASPSGSQVLDPLFFTSWQTVKGQFSQFEGCFAGETARGGYAPLILRPGSHVAVLYMYTSDSPFNIAEMSSYMSIGFPVLPNKQPNGIDLLSNGSQISQLAMFRNSSEIEAEFERQVLSSNALGPGAVTLED